MFSLIQEMFSYPFMLRALVAGALVAVCASLLGVSMVLKRYSMIGDGLSHVGFGAMALASVLKISPLGFALPVVVFSAFMLLKIKDSSKVKGDAAIAVISTGSLAVGIMAISLSTGMNTDVQNYLFGSILGINQFELILTVCLALLAFVVYILSYNRIFAVTFDENFARATGIKADLFNMLIAILTAFTVVLGMKTMGALLISSMIIFPVLTSMRVFKTFKSVVISSAIISLLCFFLGLILSYAYALPTGASIALLNIILYIIFYFFSLFNGKRKERLNS